LIQSSQTAGKFLKRGGLDGRFVEAAQSAQVVDGGNGVPQAVGDRSEADLQCFQ